MASLQGTQTQSRFRRKTKKAIRKKKLGEKYLRIPHNCSDVIIVPAALFVYTYIYIYYLFVLILIRGPSVLPMRTGPRSGGVVWYSQVNNSKPPERAAKQRCLSRANSDGTSTPEGHYRCLRKNDRLI